MRPQLWPTLAAASLLLGYAALAAAGPFVLHSTAFPPGGHIPQRFSCHGASISPPLAWGGAPAGTSRFALIMDDESPPCGSGARACRHWQVYNIPASIDHFASGQAVSRISGVTEGPAYNGHHGYAGPCPPNQHRYHITLYALARGMPHIAPGTALSRSQFRQRYHDYIIGSVTLEAVYP